MRIHSQVKTRYLNTRQNAFIKINVIFSDSFFLVLPLAPIKTTKSISNKASQTNKQISKIKSILLEILYELKLFFKNIYFASNTYKIKKHAHLTNQIYL